MKFLGIKLFPERFGILNCVENTIKKSRNLWNWLKDKIRNDTLTKAVRNAGCIVKWMIVFNKKISCKFDN